MNYIGLRGIWTTVCIMLGCMPAWTQVMGPNPSYYIQTLNNLYQLNPAMAGSNGELTGFLTYHQQVISGFTDAPRHFSISVDAPFTKPQLVAFGGNIYTFRRSILQTTGLSGTFARKLILGKKTHTLQVGVSGGFFFNSLNPDGLNLADPAINRLNGKIQPDVSVGFNYRLKEFQFGVALPKLLSFSSIATDDNKKVTVLKSKPWANQLIYLLYDFELQGNWVLRPMLIYRSFTDATPGLELNARMFYDKKFWFGAALRQNFGPAAYVGYKTKKLSVSYAYKVATSKQDRYPNPAHEIQMGTYWGKLKKKKKFNVRGGARLKDAGTFTDAVAKAKARQANPTAPKEKEPATPDKIPFLIIRKGDTSGDMNSGNFLVVNSYEDIQEAQKEMLRLRYGTYGPTFTAKIGYNSVTKIHYVYIMEDTLEKVQAKAKDLKDKPHFENVSVIKVTNRPHGAGGE